MIQRIQTIYLVLAALLLGLTFAFPFATYSLSQGDVIFNAYGVTENVGEINTYFPYYITIALSMGLALFSILQYKKRKLQITVGRLVYLLLSVTIAFVFIDFYSLKEQFEIDIINGFMPTQMDDSELAALVNSEVAAQGATSMRDMGSVMGALKAKTAGRADPAVISKLVKEALHG